MKSLTTSSVLKIAPILTMIEQVVLFTVERFPNRGNSHKLQIQESGSLVPFDDTQVV